MSRSTLAALRDRDAGRAAGAQAPAFATVAAVAAVLLAVYPPLVSWMREGAEAALRWFAGDAYYYLAIGRHSAGKSIFTFDQLHATSGFHPLWQALVTALFAAGDATAPIWRPVGAIFAISTLLLAVAAALFFRAALRLTRSPTLALLAVVPGFFALAFRGARLPAWSHWSWANGLETPLSLALAGVVLTLLGRSGAVREGSPRFDLLLGTTLALTVLARLDDVFLYATVLAAVVFAAREPAAAWRRAARIAAPGVVLIGSYLLYTWRQTGAAMPVSGAAKAGWEAGFNLAAALGALVPFEMFAPDAPLSEWASKSWRVVQLVVPALVAAAWLAWRRRAGSAPTAGGADSALAVFAVYTVVKAAYCFLWVSLWHQGWWYFPLGIVTTNLILACALGPAVRQLEAVRSTWRPGALARGALIAAAAAAFGVALALLAGGVARIVAGGSLSAGRGAATALAVAAGLAIVRARRGFAQAPLLSGALLAAAALWGLVAGSFEVSSRRLEARGQSEIGLLRRCPELDATLAAAWPTGGVVAYDDGLLATCLSRPVLSGIGLALDVEAHRERQRGRLLDLAWRRGFRLLAGSYYLRLPDDPQAGSDAIRDSLARSPFAFGSEDLSRWEFALVAHDRPSGTIFVGFSPRAGSEAAAGGPPPER